MKSSRLLQVTFVLSLLLAGCQGTGNGTKEADALVDPDNKEAVAIYKRQCIACHASDLGGRVGPGLREVGATMTAEQIAGKIADGGGGMPAFSGRLTEEEIYSLALWLDRLETP